MNVIILSLLILSLSSSSESPKADRKNQRLVLRRGDDPAGSTAGGQRTERDHRVHERSGVQASVSDALLEPAGRSGRIFKGRKTRSLQGPDLFSQ